MHAAAEVDVRIPLIGQAAAAALAGTLAMAATDITAVVAHFHTTVLAAAAAAVVGMTRLLMLSLVAAVWVSTAKVLAAHGGLSQIKLRARKITVTRFTLTFATQARVALVARTEHLTATAQRHLTLAEPSIVAKVGGTAAAAAALELA